MLLAAKGVGKTADEFMREAIKREVTQRRASHSLAEPPPWDQELAYRFIVSLPTPFVVKKLGPEGKVSPDGTILWVNPQYSQDFQITVANGRGRTVQELGLGMQRSPAYPVIVRDLRANSPVVLTEEFILTKTRGRIPYRVIRWRFSASAEGSGPEDFIGDFSFDWTRMTNEPHVDDFHRISSAESKLGVGHIFQAALESAPVAMAIKDRERRLIWCNQRYGDLVGKSPRELVSKGEKIEETFKIGITAPSVLDELSVVEHGSWLYSQEELPNLAEPEKIKTSRASLRFPIVVSEGRSPYIGMISLNLGSDDFHLELERYLKDLERRDRRPHN
jgi:PAS domain-containing protein